MLQPSNKLRACGGGFLKSSQKQYYIQIIIMKNRQIYTISISFKFMSFKYSLKCLKLCK